MILVMPGDDMETDQSKDVLKPKDNAMASIKKDVKVLMTMTWGIYQLFMLKFNVYRSDFI